MAEDDTNWRTRGACATLDAELFFPISSGGMGARQAREAQQVCVCCQVRQKCLDFALRVDEMDGVWGGTTPEERIRMRRDLAVRRPEAARQQWEVPDTASRLSEKTA